MRIVNLMEDTKGHPECRYEHGLSFYVETEKHKLLLDTGASSAFIQNAEVLGIDLKQVDTVILSHGHYDHSGGIPAFAELNPAAKIYMKSSACNEFYHVHTDGQENRYIGIDQRILDLPQCVMVEGDCRIDEELFLFSGITGRKFWAKSNLQLKQKVNGSMIQDTFDHEQCLVITQNGKNILMSGCAHNGILNILDRYREIYRVDPDIVISGFHMMKKSGYTAEEIESIEETASALKEINAVFYTGHCTGKAAYDMMKNIMGAQLKEIHSGREIYD